jgi:hexosaminidase
MIFPRIIALSEAVWSDPEKRNWSDFQARLSHHYRLLQKFNVNYCRPSDRVEIANNIDAASKTTSITLSSEQYQPEIRYTVDGSTPSISSNKYIAPFNVSGTSIIKASIFRNGKTTKTPDTLKIDFHKAIGKNVVYNKPYNNSYPAQKNETLVNGYTGSLTYQDGQWQGFTNNMDVTIDLGKEEKISTLKSTFMQVIGPGVYMPDYVEVSVSTDGKNFTPVGKDINDVSTTDPSLLFKTFRVEFMPTSARYIRFFAKNHTGFLFADELIID